MMKPEQIKNPIEENELRYALSRHVTDMERGYFEIHTHYGELKIGGELAAKVTELIKRELEKQLKHVCKAEQQWAP